MAWGSVEPGSFGDFFPNGNYVGWKEQLRDYYQNEMSSAEKAEMEMEERILFSKFSGKFTKDRGPLKPQERPTEFRTVATHKSLASLIILNSRLLAVDASLKEVIETLEPGVHQFWPIRITMPKGKEYPVQYYGMVIRRFLDSFLPDQSESGSWYKAESGLYFVALPKKQLYGGLALSRDVIGTNHLWREHKLRNPVVFYSDALQAELGRRILRIPKHYKLREI